MNQQLQKTILFIGLFVAFCFAFFAVFSFLAQPEFAEDAFSPMFAVLGVISLMGPFFSVVLLLFAFKKNFESLEQKMSAVFIGVLIFSVILFFLALGGIFTLSEAEWEQFFLSTVVQSDAEFTFEQFKAFAFTQSIVSSVEFFATSLGFAFAGLFLHNLFFSKKMKR